MSLKMFLDKSYNIPGSERETGTNNLSFTREEKVIKDFIVFTDSNLNVPRKMPIKKDFLKKMFSVIKKVKPSRS